MKVLVLVFVFVYCVTSSAVPKQRPHVIMGQQQHVDPMDPLLHALNGVGCTKGDAKVLSDTDKVDSKFKACRFECHASKSMCVKCLNSHLALSRGCGACYGDVMSCAVAKCADCFSNPSSPVCKSCYHEKCAENLSHCTKFDKSTPVPHPY